MTKKKTILKNGQLERKDQQEGKTHCEQNLVRLGKMCRVQRRKNFGYKIIDGDKKVRKKSDEVNEETKNNNMHIL